MSKASGEHLGTLTLMHDVSEGYLERVALQNRSRMSKYHPSSTFIDLIQILKCMCIFRLWFYFTLLRFLCIYLFSTLRKRCGTLSGVDQSKQNGRSSCQLLLIAGCLCCCCEGTRGKRQSLCASLLFLYCWNHRSI